MDEIDNLFIVNTNHILSEIKDIEKKLAKLPLNRTIECHPPLQGIRDKEFVVKPRFNPRNMPLNTEVKKNYIKMKENIISHFEKFVSHRNFAVLWEILCTEPNTPTYNKSIIRLLEGDVWGNPNVYGDYLVKKAENENQYCIFNTRHGQIQRNVTLNEVFDTSEGLEQFIKQDALKQIQIELRRMITVLQQEILACQIEFEELKMRYASYKPKSTLWETFWDGRKQLQSNLYIATFVLGFIAEKWLRSYVLQINNTFSYLPEMIYQALIKKLISPEVGQILSDVQVRYTSLKHNPSFQPDFQKALRLYNGFQQKIMNHIQKNFT